MVKAVLEALDLANQKQQIWDLLSSEVLPLTMFRTPLAIRSFPRVNLVSLYFRRV